MELNELYDLYRQYYRIATDTRTHLKNSIFFALKGDNFNGNQYAEKALNKGALFAIIDEPAYQTDDRMILVNDSLKCLQELAKYHREQLNIPIIALTGSNGKTTTKELIHAVLNKKYDCVATKGNLNNHIGVPLTLLSMKPNTEIGVVEMGANHLHEIDMLCHIALPDFGFITNFGRVHLEGFGNLEGVIKAKSEMYDFLRKRDKNVFVNARDHLQLKNTKGMNTLTFGDQDTDYPIEFIEANPFVKVKFKEFKLASKLIGAYNFSNIAAAVTVGRYLEISDPLIIEAIEKYIPTNNRSQIIKKGNKDIILDAYNANPNSMEVAIKNLSQLSSGKKIAILGDMFEVGEQTLQEHHIVASLIEKSKIDEAHLIGHAFSQITVPASHIKQYKSFEDFKRKVDISSLRGATILIKASRGMALERVIELL